MLLFEGKKKGPECVLVFACRAEYLLTLTDFRLIYRNDSELNTDIEIVENACRHDLFSRLGCNRDGCRDDRVTAHAEHGPPSPKSRGYKGSDEDALLTVHH